jgi:hypothetical protein
VEYHPTWGFDNPDPFGNIYSDARAAYYGANFTPTAIFDGTVTSQPPSSYPNIFNQRKNVPSPLSIKLLITTNSNNFTLKATIKRQGSMPGTGLRVHCAVTESKLSYNGKDYDFVLRRMYPDANGTSFTINDGQTKTVTINGTLSGGWVKSNLHFVVWVQSNGAKTVFQSKLAKWNQVAVEPASVGRVKALFL